MTKETALSLKDISFSYSKNSYSIDSFNLDVEKGSFTTLLGPSGCGKTTLLRLISGFLEPQKGSIYIEGIDQKGINVEQRHVGIVFQDYALFPHLTVKQNILYGLNTGRNKKELKLSKDSALAKVIEVSENLGLSDLLDRYPHQLSGGQQQRVALARSLVLQPKILLMDEPLSSLDTKMREKIRMELKEIQQNLKITTIYVTHDQEEALSLSDSIAVINEGKLLQYGSPRELYYKPADRFTADFVGKANFITIENEEWLVRPEWFEINKNENQGQLQGTILSESFLGNKTRFTVLTQNNEKLTVDLPTLDSNFLNKGSAVSLNITHKWKM